MKKIYTVLKGIIIAASLLITATGCEKAAVDTPGAKGNPGKDDGTIVVETGAGANYTVPNIFGMDGTLLTAGGAYNTQATGTPMELWMGVGNEKAGTLVGHVTFLTDKVRIDLTDLNGDGKPDMFPYVITEAHLHFAPTVGDIPHAKNGNPIPGQFEYNVKVAAGQSVIEIPVEFDAVGAIHLSVVKYGGVEGFGYYLPSGPVKMIVTYYPTGPAQSYFQVHVSGAGFISSYDMGYGPGIYEGWCIDVDNLIYIGKEYDATLYSSYEDLPDWMLGEGRIEKPENLEKINYLVNNFKVGQAVQLKNADCTPYFVNGEPVYEPLTYGDIQRAIWSFIDDDQYPVAGWSQQRVDAIICAVNAFGKGFVPSCTQKIVFIVVPTDPGGKVQLVIGQPVIAEIEVPCETVSGTAWGDGKFGAGFPGAKQWGTYFSVAPSAPNGN